MSHVACKETERIRCAVWHQRKRNNLTKEAAMGSSDPRKCR